MNKSLVISFFALFGLSHLAFAMQLRPYGSIGQEQLNSQLHHPIECGEEAEAKRLIEAGANVSASCSISYAMPLPAAGGGQIICDVSMSFDSPLMHAVDSGREALCEQLIILGADVNLTSVYGFTPLMRAVQRGQEQVCKCLLEHGANVNQENTNGDTALMLAAQFGQESIFKLLIDHKANVYHKNAKGNTPFIKAAESGWESTCIHLINLGVNQHHENNHGNTAFMETVRVWRNGSTPILQIMGNDVKKYKSTCEMLFKRGANVNHANAQGNTALMVAAGYLENNHPSDPGNEQICKFLIELGANVNHANKNGITPLMISVGCGIIRCTLKQPDVKICEVLVKSGANVNHQDEQGFTALMHAAQYGYGDICELLLSNGADLNLRCGHCDTALTIAAKCYKINAFKTLITNASFNAFKSNIQGFTNQPIKNVPSCLIENGKLSAALFAADNNLRDALRYLIKNEQEKILAAVFSFTDESLAHEFIEAHKRGVCIELITDQSCLHNPNQKIDIIAQSGIPVNIYRKASGFMHNKFALFSKTIHDKEVLWTGSFNFSKAGNDTNQENVLILEDAKTVQKYAHEFERLKSKTKRYVQLLAEQKLLLPLEEVRALIATGKLDKDEAIALIKAHHIACLKPLLQQAIQSTHYGKLGLLPNPDTLEKDFGTEIETNIRKRLGNLSWSEWAHDFVPMATCTLQ